MTVLVSTHYMDEAERCHQIAYISFGRLLAAGTGDEILRASGLRTWEIVGDGLAELSRRLNADSGWQVVPFGTRLHVTSRGEDLAVWLARHAADLPVRAQEIAASLEDLFISLMGHEAELDR